MDDAYARYLSMDDMLMDVTCSLCLCSAAVIEKRVVLFELINQSINCKILLYLP